MSWLRNLLCNMKFGRRLGLGFSIIGVLLLATGLFGIREAFILADLTGKLHRHPYSVSTAARDVRGAIYAIHRDMKDVALSPDTAGIDAAMESVHRFDRQAMDALTLMEERFLGDKSDIVRLGQTMRGWSNLREEVAAAKRQGRDQLAADISRTRGADMVKSLTDQIDAVVAFADDKAAEFMDNAQTTRSFALWALTAMLLFAIMMAAAVAMIITKSVTGPMEALRATMERLAGGDHGLDIPCVKNRDEIGDMARTVEIFKKNAIAKEEAEAAARAAAEEVAREQEERRRVEEERREKDAAEAEAERKRARELGRLVSEFEARVVEMMGMLSSASSELTATAENLNEVAASTASRSEVVRGAGEDASHNVATAAGATEEMSAAISEISSQVASANTIAEQAVGEVKSSGDKVRALSASASRVGDVVTLINDIAEQTNLLALNATIEAARAGESGKGFAVVASEVKTLAAQTRKAIEEISGLIHEIQEAGGDAVSTMDRMEKVISKISEANANIASAVEQQSGATAEIARNVQQASDGTRRVAEEISGVAAGASETGSAATQMRASAAELERLTADMKTHIDQFISGVRAA